MVENTQQQSSNTIKINGVDIDRNDYISQLNQQYDSFFNTYKDMWNKKQQQEILNQRNALLQNIQNGNINQIDGNTIKFNNSDNTGIDMTPDGAGAINAGYAGKIGGWMVNQAKVNRKVNKFDSNSLTKAWTDYVFGGSTTPDKQSWIDRDPAGKDGKRGTNGRVAATLEFLNSLDLNKYTDFDPALGDINSVKANIENLKAKLSDGVLNNDDYAAAQRLGFNLRAILSDNLDMAKTNSLSDIPDTTSDSTTDITGNSTTDENMTDEQRLLDYGNQALDTTALWNIVNGWGKHDDIDIITSNRTFGALDSDSFFNIRLLNDTQWKNDAYKLADYYQNTFFPKFFTDYFQGKSDGEIKQILNSDFGNNKVYGMYQKDNEEGFKNYGEFISGYLTLAIKNKIRRLAGTRDAQFLNSSDFNSLQPILNDSGDETGYWTVPRTLDEKTGTVLGFNPNTGNYKRIYIGNYKKGLYLPWLKSKGISIPGEQQSQENQTVQQSQESQQSQQPQEADTPSNKHGGILKGQYGMIAGIDDTDWDRYINKKQNTNNHKTNTNASHSDNQAHTSHRQYSTASQQIIKDAQAKSEGYQSLGDKQKKQEEDSKDATRKEFYNQKGSFTIDPTTAQGREILGAGLDLIAMISSFAPGLGTATSLATGLSASALRAWNKYRDDNNFSWSDVLTTAADIGGTALGAIPGLGAIAKSKRLQTSARIIMGSLAGMGIYSNSNDIVNKLEKAASGEELTIQDWQQIGGFVSSILGLGTNLGGRSAGQKLVGKASEKGKIVRSNDTETKYKLQYSDDNGTKTLVTTSKEKAEALRDAINSKGNGREAKIKEAMNNIQAGSGDNVKISSLNEKGKFSKNSFDNAGIQETKSQGEFSIQKVNGNEFGSGLNGRLQKMFYNNAVWYSDKNWKEFLTGPFRKMGKSSIDAYEAGRAKFEQNHSSSNTHQRSNNNTDNNTPNPSSAQATTIEPIDSFKQSNEDVNPKDINVNFVKTKLANIVNDNNKEAFKEIFQKRTSKISEDFFNKIKADLPEIEFLDSSKNSQKLKDINYSDFVQNSANLKTIQKTILGSLYNPGQYRRGQARKAAIEAIMNLKKGGTLYTLKAQQGTKVTPTIGGITNSGNGTSWYNNIFKPSQQFIIDQLKSNNNDDNLMNQYNSMQTRHHDLYEGAGGASGNFTQNAYSGNKDAVSQYQTDYSALDKDNFNKLTIGNAWTAGRYGYYGNEKRSGTGDSKEDWKSDGLYSGQTDDRRLFGREGDWQQSDIDSFNGQLKDLNMEMYLDPNTKYYMLRRLEQPSQNQNTDQSSTLSGINPEQGKKEIWGEINQKAKSLLPATLQLASVLRDNRFNKKQMQQQLAHLHPVLDQSYNTFSPVHGDLATRQSYIDSGIKQQNQANRQATNTSNAYLANAAMLQADQTRAENKAKGDLYDNQAIEKSMLQAKQEQDQNLGRNVAVANKNRLALNNNERERNQVVLATNATNNLNWKNFYRANVEIPAERKEKDRKATQDMVDTQSAIQQVYIKYDNEIQNLTRQYSDLYNNAKDPNQQRAVTLQYNADLASIQNRRKLAAIEALARNGKVSTANIPKIFEPSGSYTPPDTFRLSQPDYESDTTQNISDQYTPVIKSAKGSKANWLSQDTMVKELNKEKDRNMKYWQKELDNFWKQLSKMKQAKYGN